MPAHAYIDGHTSTHASIHTNIQHTYKPINAGVVLRKSPKIHYFSPA